MDEYAKEIKERVSDTQRPSIAAFQLTFDVFKAKAEENEVKALGGVETIQSIGEKVDGQTREAIDSLKVAADTQNI